MRKRFSPDINGSHSTGATSVIGWTRNLHRTSAALWLRFALLTVVSTVAVSFSPAQAAGQEASVGSAVCGEKIRSWDKLFQGNGPDTEEDAAPGCPEAGTSICSVVFALSNGAYAVSTNNGGGVPAGGTLAAYRANAAAAKYSRVVAREILGSATRPRGYLYGASGGGYQTVGSLENTSGVWDGGVPMVFGVPNAIPNFMTSQLLALRVLHDELPQIADAVAPGGSADPYAGLNPEQRNVLKEVTRLGAPLRGWWQYATMNGGGFWAVQGVVRAIDPSYMEDFWSKPGYEGSEPSVQARSYPLGDDHYKHRRRE